MKKEHTSKLSFEQALELESETDRARLEAMTGTEIDFSDAPKVTPEAFARAVVRRGGVQARANKVPLTLRVDPEVLEWFKARGQGYQTEMGTLLRAYMDEHLKRAS
jgi:uncharacterized protein (DUF4415 family)